MAEMRCKTCGYDLRNLPEHRCPGMRGAFDPLDRETLFEQPFSGRG